MRNRLSYSQAPPSRRSRPQSWLAFLWVAGCLLLCLPLAAVAGDAPPWMHAVVNVPLPAHDEKTDAVLLFSEESVNVLSADKIRTTVRLAYKILRPSGREYGVVAIPFNSPREKITFLRGWCIPAQGKDYEVKDKEAAEVSLPKIEGSELVTDLKAKLLRIPAPDPGNIVGYEYEKEEQALVLQDTWEFQTGIPARERHYSLQLPPGWEYKSWWLNYPEVKPTQAGNPARWVVSDLKAIREEEDMPPRNGVAGQMIVSFFPPGGSPGNGFTNWQGMGGWYRNLCRGRDDASPEMKQRVAALTGSLNPQLGKMKAIANFVQHDIRYVAIELGVGGWQPHPASEVFLHRYGDCKDKAALMISMLHEIGVESFDVRINSTRGSIRPDTPAHLAFNHAIIAIKLRDSVADRSLIAIVQHPRHGRLLFFDPTDDLTPFGQIPGHLQANYGLLLTPDSSELIELPKQPAAMNGVQRTATLTLDATGALKGDVKEVRLGDRAAYPRRMLHTVTKDADRIKPIENVLGGSLSNFRITKASVVNLEQTDEPFGFNYSFEVDGYAKKAGNLLLVRPRVLGSKSSAILETKETRKFPIEFDGPMRDTDSFEITLPPGYEVDELPPPVNADYSFASYHSKAEAAGNVVRYTRTYEVKELSVPVSKSEELKRLYRIIASDERNTAVLRPAAK